jgi:hypothetical protein
LGVLIKIYDLLEIENETSSPNLGSCLTWYDSFIVKGISEIRSLVAQTGHSMCMFLNSEEHQKQDSHRTKYLSSRSFLKAVSRTFTDITMQYHANLIILVECEILELLQLYFLFRISFCSDAAYHFLHELSRVWHPAGIPPTPIPDAASPHLFDFCVRRNYSIGSAMVCRFTP